MKNYKKKVKSGEITKDSSLKDMGILASEYIYKMFNVKLSKSQKENLNDLGAKNLIAVQEFLSRELKIAAEEKFIDKKTGREKKRKKLKDLLV